MTISIPLEKARWLGIIGSALTLLLYVPGFGGILNLLGALFLLLALKSLARNTNTPRIFHLFAIYLVVLIGTAVLTATTTSYIISAIESETIGAGIKLLETVLTLMPAVAVLFFAKSYTLLSKKTDIRWFWAAGMLNLFVAVLLALIGLTFIFTEGSRILGAASTLLSLLGYIAVPVLGAIAFVQLKPHIIKYRHNS